LPNLRGILVQKELAVFMRPSFVIDFRILRRVILSALLVAFVTGNGVLAASIEPLEILTRTGIRAFDVELAVTEEEHARGLMGRRELPAGRGLLFDFGRGNTMAMMWMKDTHVALDMIFIRSDGSIAKIVEDTMPLSTAPIFSETPIRGVLEVAAGTVRRLGIAPGDRVAHRIFGPR
jgi:uncharacterized membrane protein (UPF0127 family)